MHYTVYTKKRLGKSFSLGNPWASTTFPFALLISEVEHRQPCWLGCRLSSSWSSPVWDCPKLWTKKASWNPWWLYLPLSFFRSYYSSKCVKKILPGIAVPSNSWKRRLRCRYLWSELSAFERGKSPFDMYLAEEKNWKIHFQTVESSLLGGFLSWDNSGESKTSWKWTKLARCFLGVAPLKEVK